MLPRTEMYVHRRPVVGASQGKQVATVSRSSRLKERGNDRNTRRHPIHQSISASGLLNHVSWFHSQANISNKIGSPLPIALLLTHFPSTASHQCKITTAVHTYICPLHAVSKLRPLMHIWLLYQYQTSEQPFHGS